MATKKKIETAEKIKTAINLSQTFIENNRRPDGLWSDFLTLAGESVHWISGYVGYAMIPSLDIAVQGSWLSEVGLKILQQQNVDGGWGYGPGVPSDADSTSWCLLFLSKLGIQLPKSKESALLFLLNHQSKIDGGFSTYANPREIAHYMRIDENISFEGWSSSQMCVTAVACQALMENKTSIGVDEALEFIRKGQADEGFWNPYWWSGKLYANFNCMQALKRRGISKDIESLRRAQGWIADSQLLDGGWSDWSTQKESWAFSTALAIKALLLMPDSQYSKKIEAGMRWLLRSQLSDGSWKSNHILRIPYPFIKEPWIQDCWRTDGKAINAAIKDQNRLYTTATVLSALTELKKTLSETI